MMDVKEKLVELLDNFHRDVSPFAGNEKLFVVDDNIEQAEYLIAHGVTVQERPRPLEEWCEDYGDALWWKFPIEEPPYVGSPLDEEWPGYHTHWTPIILPHSPSGGQNE